MQKNYYIAEDIDQVVIGAIGYKVTHQDGQIIFEVATPIYGCHTIFAFEKTKGINNTAGIWYLVHMDSSSERVPAHHIYGAIEYCEDVYGRCFEGVPT